MLKTGDLDRPAHPECPPANRRDTQRESYSRRFGNRPSSEESVLSAAGITGGLIWLIYLVAQVVAKGLRAAVLRRLLCFSLFWHALDIVWVGVFTLVYLMGDFR